MINHIRSLDGLRGVTAGYILFHHARLMLTQSYKEGLKLHPEAYSLIDKSMVYSFGIFKFGHEAVVIFFVLSGFLIHYKQVSKGINQLDLTSYFKKRVLRIYPTLLTALLLCFLVDIFLVLKSGTGTQVLLDKYSISSFLTNLFLIPDSPAWGENYPIWSLKHEWFFYLMYPILLALSRWHKSIPFITVIALYASYLTGLKIPFIVEASYTLSIWCMGALAAELYVFKKISNKNLRLCLILTILIYLLIYNHLKFTYKDIIFGLLVSSFLLLILNDRLARLSRLLSYFSWLGGFSYSLYLLHSPLLKLYKYVFVIPQGDENLPIHSWHVVIGSITALLLSYGIYYVTERFALNYKKTIK